MYYISISNHSSIKRLNESFKKKWNENDELIETESFYEINQSYEFYLTDNIKGKQSTEEKTIVDWNGKNKYTEYKSLYIYSEVLSINELKKWVEERLQQYMEYLKTKTFDKQYLLNLSWNEKESDINIDHEPWNSNVSFDNSYFPDKENILSQINFFLENEQWYKEKGVPYNLGILLHGKPGGGKTRWIKQLLNHTNRHGIDIKLSDEFDLEKLKTIIFSETVGYEFIIPQNKRIIIFEDIDAMGDVVKDRDKKSEDNKITKLCSDKSKENENDNKSEKTSPLDLMEQVVKMKKKKANNNLSNLLNIFDGLHECSGRIIIMTTNKPDFLDKALIRPGRIDIQIEFGNLSKKDVYLTLKSFWKDELDITLDEINDDFDGTKTAADIIMLCRLGKTFSKIRHHFI